MIGATFLAKRSASAFNTRHPQAAITSNKTVMLHVLIFIGLAIILVSMTATTRKPQGMTKEAITRGWLRDALDKALSEDKAKPSPVGQFAFSVKYGKPDTDKAAQCSTRHTSLGPLNQVVLSFGRQCLA